MKTQFRRNPIGKHLFCKDFDRGYSMRNGEDMA